MALLTVTLALGIGANAAVFTVLDTVLLRPLPYPAPDRLVRLFESNDSSPRMGVSSPNFHDWREQATSFAALAAYAGGPETILGGREPVVADVYRVTEDFLRVLGTSPQLGRDFETAEHQVGGPPAVVVSNRFWRDVLGGEPDLSRLVVHVERYACRVVGVMPAGFAFPERADLYLPKGLDVDPSRRTAHNLRVIGRLAPGVSVEAARAEMQAIAARLEAEYTADHDAERVVVVDLREQLTGQVRRGLVLLQVVVLFVLFAACANVAGGLLTRGAERRKELGIRAALGASRVTLVRDLLVEGSALAMAGGAVGSLLAWWGVRTLRALGPSWLPRLAELSLDWRVVAFVAGVSAATVLLFGMLPALQGSRVDVRESLTADGRSVSATMRSRTRHLLVGIEVALALTLLLGTGLLLRSLVNVMTADAGFNAGGVLAMRVTLPPSRYTDVTSGAMFFDRALARLARLPGVSAAGVTSALPLAGPSASGGFQIESRPDLSSADWQRGPLAGYRLASPDYFRALGIPVVRGRSFTDGDTARTALVAVVNQALADRYFPGGDPVGQRIRFLGMDEENPWLTIVGVAANVRHDGLDSAPAPEVFAHYAQLPFRTRSGMVMVVRTATGDAAALGAAARGAIRMLDPEVPLVLERMVDVVNESVGNRRLTVGLVGAFTLVAFLLSMAGIYGVVSHTVTSRTREMGIRMALGADARSVVLLVLRSSALGFGAGVVAGLAGGLMAARAMRGFLFDVAPTDPLSFTAAVGVLTITALLAAWLPARRATRIDPLQALQ